MSIIENNQRDNKRIQGSSQRPRSAVTDPGRFASQSLGKFFTQQQSQSNTLDEKTVSAIWQGFGSYIAKQLRNGKGISVPRFGNFTFSATLVDLAGTTNPSERDKQVREPVFLVGKDFVSAVSLRAGVAHNRGATVRPYDLKGSSGIIPKVKINYTEVAFLSGQNKDICKTGCEQVFRFLSDKVRKGENVSMEIPFVGQFVVKGGIAAISFIDDLQEETKGVTAKNHFVNRLFASSVNQLNLKIHDQNKNSQNPALGLGGALRVTGDAEGWLKNNLNISVQDMVLQANQVDRVQSAQANRGMQRYGSLRPEDLKRKSWALQSGLTEQNKQQFDKISEQNHGALAKRPMSAASRITSGSRMTNVPEIGRMKLMLIANDIFRNRQAITDVVISNPKGSLREMLSSSEILQILKKIGIYLEIGHLKSLLKELGFNWNGKSCSLVALFQQVQLFIYGQTQSEDKSGNYFTHQTTLTSPKNEAMQGNNPRLDKLIQSIKDLFYSTGKSVYEIYQESRLGQVIDLEGFRKVIQDYSKNQVSDADIQQAFQYAARGQDSLSYQEFERVFKWALPAGSDWETKCFRAIREWMFKNGLSSETAFELLLKKVDRILQKKLSRSEFHRAINECIGGLGFSAPEVDNLFKLLDSNQDGILDIEEWKSRIYEDSLNPLQMLREIVANNKITADDLLFRMQLRIWDAPLDFPRLCEALRRLDPTLSETQLRHLAKVLKNDEGKVEITAMLRNLCGQDHETVDFRNKIFRRIYAEIHPHKEQKLLQLLEEADPLNDGRVEPLGLKTVLNKVLKGAIDEDSIDRFVRFLDKDKSGKIKFMDFLGRMSEVSNRDHNPFKSVVQRVAYFIESNQQSINSVLRRLMAKVGPNDQLKDQIAVSVDVFAEFLKSKVDKKRSSGELRQYAHYIDVDKDGFVSEIDLQTCINNLNSNSFFKNGGEALAQSGFASQTKFFPSNSSITEERAAEIAAQIRQAMINQKIAYREAFNRFDANKDGFLSLNEFQQGIDKIITLSVPVKEKMFGLMDKNSIGLVDYASFLEVINLSSATKLSKGHLNDNFDWENGIIDQIKQWVARERITIEEGFKSFDRDFDGYVSKDDLRWGLINILKVKEEEILPTKLDRLFRLLDFYKTGQIQPSDFQRLVNNENPYSASGQRGSQQTETFRKSFGGSFVQASTFDWKVSAIQQMGLVLSKKYGSINQSYEAASERLGKITFDQFKKFIEANQALAGFNMTLPLIQKLFAELDPHKKGYLTENDWSNALAAFNYNDQILIELKNAIQVSFSDCESAFAFFLTFKGQSDKSKTINQQDFEKAVESLTAGRFKQDEIEKLWVKLTEGGRVKTMDKYHFRSVLDNMRYTGSSTVRNVKTAPPGARTTIVSQSSSSSQWDVDIFEKLRQIIKTSSQNINDIFREFDSDGNGFISQVEFRNAIRKLQLGLTSREVDKLMLRIDTNQDGKIDYNEFTSKFKSSELDDRLKERAKDRMGRLKELMILHMTSPNDAFRFFDESKLGKLTYQEFSKLIIKLHELAGEKALAYPVIKDLFDTVDIRKDGIIDISEWQQTFGNVTEGSSKLSIKPTPLTQWENSREFHLIGQLIARNRKLLREQFEKLVGTQTTIINFEQGKQIMGDLLREHFSTVGDDKIKQILRVAELQGANTEGIGNQYDYVRMLDVFKNRHAGPQV